MAKNRASPLRLEMGNRKTKTVARENFQVSRKTNTSAQARNLPKNELGAIIFGCRNHTIKECLQNRIFGLPTSHFSYVKNIVPGLTLFHFNYSDRTLHGIYEAASPGQMNINSSAWTSGEGTEYTPYAAQVRFNVQRQCRPLLEIQFKSIIADNYYTQKLFWFELDKEQAGRLTALFLSSPLPERMLNPRTAFSHEHIFEAPRSGLDEADVDLEADLGRNDNKIEDDAPQKWTDLFKASSSVKEKGSDLEWGVASSTNEIRQQHLEVCTEALDSSSRNNWDDFDDLDSDVGENDAAYEQDNARDGDIQNVPFSDDRTLESLVSRETAEAELDGRAESDDRIIETVEMKLMQEIEGMKMYQFKQSIKIDSLEKELAYFKLEIDQLKKHHKQLEITSSYGANHSDEDACESPNVTTGASVFIAGGYDGFSWTRDLNSYSPSEDKVVSHCSMTFQRAYAAVANLNDELYVFGGVHDGVLYDTVESYNPQSNQWVQRPSLYQKKGSVAGASMLGKIFAIGGGDGIECFSEVELFDISVGRWISTRSMHEKRFAPAAVEMNGALYVAGGYDGRDYLRSVEMFDPRERSWSCLHSMNSRRGGHSMVAFKEKLYAFGGYDGAKMASTTEFFDPRVGVWVNMEPMTVSRGYFGSCVIDGKIHVIGGLDENEKVVDVVEWYEEGSGWQQTAKSGLGKRCFFSALLCEQFS